MPTFTGTDSGETLVGTGSDDTLDGLGGDDTLFAGPGRDTVNGGAGNDTIVVAEPPTFFFNGSGIVTDAYDGGADFDTLELRNFTDGFLNANGQSGFMSTHSLTFSPLAGIEQIRFVSSDAVGVQAFATLPQLSASGVTQIEGGVGRDVLYVAATTAGVHTIPLFTLSNWTNTSAPHLSGDMIGMNVGGPGDFTLNAREGLASAQLLSGGTGNDILNGSSGSEILIGGGGANVLNGNGGNDLVAISNANDSNGIMTTYNGAGSTFNGGDGMDLLSIGGPVDFHGTLSGVEGIVFQRPLDSPAQNNGFDMPAAHLIIAAGLLNAMPANLTINGSDGTLTVNVSPGNSYNAAGYTLVGGITVTHQVFGSLANDSIGGLQSADTLNGSDGNDTLNGNGGDDGLFGGAGNDLLVGGAGADAMWGQLGDDWYFVDSALDSVTEGAGEGTLDRIYTNVSYTLGADVHVERLFTGSNAGTAAINLTGNALGNVIYGNAGANVLDGKASADLLAGLAGDDWYYVDHANDTISETAGNGTDRVLASMSYTLTAGQHIERLTTTSNAGTGAINLTGNEHANVIYGNAGANVLDGKGGADTLLGLEGADTFAFTTALGGGNVDAINGFVAADDTIRLENAVFTGLAAGALATGAFNNGAAATQADDRVIYNVATGALLFDADGLGGAAAVQFAALSSGLALTGADFVVV